MLNMLTISASFGIQLKRFFGKKIINLLKKKIGIYGNFVEITLTRGKPASVNIIIQSGIPANRFWVRQ